MADTTDPIDALNTAIDGTPDTETTHPAANADQAALLAWADAHPIDAPTLPINGRQQYHVTPPEGTKPKGHTRVTTFSSTLDDGAGLTVWRNRLLVRGLAQSPALVAQAQTATDDRALGTIADTALHVAGEKLAADVGSALHLATEHHDATGAVPNLPAAWQPDIDAYADCINTHSLNPAHREVYGYVSEFELIGKIDCLAAGPWGDTLRVVDLKTGKSCDRLTYAVQLASYANCTHIWADGEWIEAPAIDRQVGYIAHLPAGSGTCELIEVDLVAGWELAKLAAQVRDARASKRVKSMFAPATASAVPADTNPEPAEPAEPAEPYNRITHLQERLRALKRRDRADLAQIITSWPADVPKQPPWTDDQADALEAHLYQWDHTETPFLAPPDQPTAPTWTPPPPPRPDLPTPEDGDPVEPGDAEALRAVVRDKLTDDQRRHASAWLKDARRAGVSFGAIVDGTPTARRWAVDRAALKSLMAFSADTRDETDALARAAITLAAPDLHVAGFSLGALLSALTTTEANRLADIADAYRAGDKQTAADLVAVID